MQIKATKAEVTIFEGVGEGHVVVIYDDAGSLCGQDPVHIALLFKNLHQAKKYCEESLVPGRDATIKVYPVRFK